MRETFVSPKEILCKEYGVDPRKPMVIQQSMKHMRDAELPGFCVVGGCQKFGPSKDELRVIAPRVMLQFMDFPVEEFKWLPGMSESKKLKLGCQVIPPTFAAAIGLAVANSIARFGRGQNSFSGGKDGLEELLPDVCMVKRDGYWRMGRVAEARAGTAERTARSLVCLADDLQAQWYYRRAVLAVDDRLNTPCEDVHEAKAF